MIDELYKKYGELIVKLEILNGQINQVKQQIASELNKESKKSTDVEVVK